MSTKSKPVAIVGAGLAGLSCALTLEELGLSTLLFDKEAEVGGRMRTDVSPVGFRFDHGFQVALPAYPEWKRQPILAHAALCYFQSGAVIRSGRDTFRLSNPLNHPGEILSTLTSGFASFQDKLLIGRLCLKLATTRHEKLLASDYGSSLHFLRSYGFSERSINNFWKPFFAGVFLDDSLQTPASFMLFLCKMFAESPVAVPRLGIGELPKLMASCLRSTQIFLNSEISRVGTKWVELNNGKRIDTLATVVAVRADQFCSWTGVAPAPLFHTVHTFYYEAPEAPYPDPCLMLQASGTGRIINHIVPISNVSSAYAPAGKSLLSINVLGNRHQQLSLSAIEVELAELFGPETRHWKYLKHYSLPQALPRYPLPLQGQTQHEGVYLCGDFTDSPSQQGALASGRRTARALAGDLL